MTENVENFLLLALTEKKVDEVPRKHICSCSILWEAIIILIIIVKG